MSWASFFTFSFFYLSFDFAIAITWAFSLIVFSAFSFRSARTYVYIYNFTDCLWSASLASNSACLALNCIFNINSSVDLLFTSDSIWLFINYGAPAEGTCSETGAAGSVGVAGAADFTEALVSTTGALDFFYTKAFGISGFFSSFFCSFFTSFLAASTGFGAATGSVLAGEVGVFISILFNF